MATSSFPTAYAVESGQPGRDWHGLFSAEIWLQPTVQPPGGPNDYRVPFSEFGGYGSGIYWQRVGLEFFTSRRGPRAIGS